MAVGIADMDAGENTIERTSAARRILVEALLLGLLADGGLRNAPDGLGWTIWVIALALAAANVARHLGLRVTREQTAWLGAAVACSAAFAWRDADALRAANILGTLVSLAMFSMAAAGAPAPSILAARLRDVVTAGVYTVRDIGFGAPVLAARDAELHTLPAVRGGASWTALRAGLLTVPLAIVFTVLLSRADPVFASVFELPEIDGDWLVSHAVLIGAFSWWSAGFVRGALLGVTQRPALPQQLPIRLGLVDVTATLGVPIALFTVFVALQVRWLFGGADVVLATTGLTVAEYARRGFFELVAVAVLVFPLILGSRAVVQDDDVLRRHRSLSLALIGLLGAIMVSAVMRMSLYVGYFGLTTDRLYATALMGWLALVFGAMALTIFRGWSRPFAAMTVISAFLTLLALNAVDPEPLVARVNLGRSGSARAVDYVYLAGLSGDATPTVVKALNSATPSPESCRAAKALRLRWMRRQDASWNLGTWRGRRAILDGLSPLEVLRLCGRASTLEPAIKPINPD